MTAQASPLVGTIVDTRYRVDEFVARGGMATVYRARDLRLERTVALKVMHASLAEDPQFVDRFVREARSAASLSHPAIVAVYDQGAADSIVYLAMEYVPGCTLRDLIASEGRLDAATALSVLEPVLEALTAAHKAGYVHRDIKPENVLISEDGRVKVADFGLARAIAASTSSGITRGLLIGTVAYLAPEQVEKGHADARTDVYSSGILLYECLVGQAPFSGDTPLSIAYQHVHSQVPAPSSIRPEIAPAVDGLVAIATSQDPNSRYADASDFVAHLRTVRAMLGVPVASVSGRTIVLERENATVKVGPWGATSTQELDRPQSGHDTNAPPTVTLEPPSFAPPPPPVVVQGKPPKPPKPPKAAKLPKRRKPRKYRILAALLALLLIGSAAAYGAFKYAQAQIVKVPAVLGMTETEASAELAKFDMKLSVAGADYSTAVPKGEIITADPDSGTEVRKGQTVTVRTSLGPEMVVVPKVAGLTAAKALERLAAGRLVGTSSEEFNDTVPAGQVISAEPKNGASVLVGSGVSVVVSKGPPPVTIPRVLTMSKADATAKLQAAGLKVVAKPRLGAILFNRVYSQDPGGGGVVPKGTTVTIYLV